MGGAAVGAIVGAASAAAQAAAAAKASRKQREFSAQQRATAFQVQRQDLEAAGYNPLYAFYQGSSGAPHAQYQQPNLSSVGDIGAAAGTYLDYKNKQADYWTKRNTAQTVHAQGNLNAALGAESSAKTALTGTQNKIAKEQLKGARVEGQIDASPFGKATRTIKRGIDAINPLTRGIGRRGGRTR